MIIIGSARKDENGKYVGGKVGDQTGHEVETQEFYVHSKGWYVLVPKDKAIAAKIAEAMQIACDNIHIGYNQDDRDGIIPLGVKTTKNCNCDCSSLVRACIMYATGKSFPDFYTGDEAYTLERSGLFEKRVAYTGGMKLQTGSVLVTQKKGHTVVIVKGEDDVPSERPVISRGYNDTSKGGCFCHNLQTTLNYLGYSDNSRSKLDADGSCGSKTCEAITNAQIDLKSKGLYTSTIDGTCGPNTWKAIDELVKMEYTVETTTDVNCRKPATIQSLGKVIKVIPVGTKVKVSNWNGKWLFCPEHGGYISGNCAARKN